MTGEQGGRGESVYLSVEDVLEIYAAIIDAKTAQVADHLRSRDALAGALGRPASYAHYEQADLALQAAVLAHGIAETQPFVDGNERTALVAMLTFLEINGHRVQAPDPGVDHQLQPRHHPPVIATAIRSRLTENG